MNEQPPKKVKQKKKRTHDGFYRIIYALFYLPFRIDALCRFGVWGRAKTYKEPVLILCNHTTDRDFLAVASYIRNHMYFVCSDHVVAMGLFGKLFGTLFHPITVFKGSVKAGGVMEILRRIKRGRSVLLFPEGRISHNGLSTSINRATAQLAQTVGCRVVTFRTKGGFFKQPRWQTYINRGKLFDAGIVHEYSPEELRAMSVEEVLQHISEDLFTDAYAEQEKRHQPFVWKHGIEQITRYYCVCPSCRGIDTLKAEGMTVTCTCGYSLTMDDCGYFHGTPATVTIPSEWEKLQQAVLTDRVQSDGSLTDEAIILNQIGAEYAKSKLFEGKLEGNATEMRVGDLCLPYHEIDQLEVLRGGSALLFSHAGVQYELVREGACLAKYITLWEQAKACL